MRQIAGLLFVALCGLLFALAIASCGCERAPVQVEHRGGQTIKIDVSHDEQKVKVDVHRIPRREDRRRRRESPSPELP